MKQTAAAGANCGEVVRALGLTVRADASGIPCRSIETYPGTVRSWPKRVKRHRRSRGSPDRRGRGAPVEPATLSSAVPNWRAGDTIHLGKKTLRVIGKRDDDADQAPVLIVEAKAE